MYSQKIAAVLATTLVGLTVIVGCQNDKTAASTGAPEEALGESADGLLGALKQSAPPQQVQARASQVTCDGDQNTNGRRCCDATHCCINIKGVIRCDLGPAPTKK